MSFVNPPFNSLMGGGLRFAGSTRGRIQGSNLQGINYPSPFFDVAHTYLPPTIKQLFRWCRYYFLTNPLINATIIKLSQYPITDIIVDCESSEQRKQWEEYLQTQLHYRAFMAEVGLDYYCLAGETPVVTEAGILPIRELAGRTVRVLSSGGVYRDAQFKSYGVQRLWEVHTDDGVHYATEEHSWPVYDHGKKKEVRKTTRQLKGCSVPRVVASRPPQNEEFWDGVRHGIVFGDGTVSNEGRQAHVLLYTKEKRVLARYFEQSPLCPTRYTITLHHEDKYLGVYGLPPHYKKLPLVDASPSYWYGFNCGLFATDGSVDVRGDSTHTQKDPLVLVELAKRLPWFGLLGGKVREHWAWNSFTKQEEPMNYLALKKQYLQPQDFIRPDQLERFEANYEKTDYGKYARVKKVVPTNRVEEVFCCEEPETHSFVIGNGMLTGNCYGNAFVSISYPFKKNLICRQCRHTAEAKRIRRYWIFTSLNFRLTCPKCGHTGVAEVWDRYDANPSGIRLMRWNPENIEIADNEISGEPLYFYRVPGPIENDITIGRKDVVESVPQSFVEALREKKSLIFPKDNLFHFKRPSLAEENRGWGIPLLLPVLKDTFYLQIMKKAQECIALETLLETPEGLRRAEDVQVGDLVRSHTGAYRHVTQKKIHPLRAAQGEFALQISVSGLRQLPSVVSHNHPMYALRCNDQHRRSDTKEHRRSSYVLRNPSLYEFKFVEAQELEVGQYVGYPIARSRECMEVDIAQYTPNFVVTGTHVYSGVSEEAALAFERLEGGGHAIHDNAGRVAKRVWAAGKAPKRFPRILELDEDLAYIAGWYVGDGSAGAHRVDFSMGPEDNGIELALAVDRVFACVCTTQTSDRSRGWNLCASETIFSEFMSHWIPGLAQTKRIPREIVEAPDEIVLAFLRGYFEADGWHHEDEWRIAVTLSNGGLAYQLYQLTLSLRCIATISERESLATTITDRKGKETHLPAGRPVFYFAVSTASAKRLCGLMRGEASPPIESGESGFFLGDYFAARINHMERVEDCEKVVSFEVEEEHTFCLPGMATHNSILLEHIVPLRIIFPQPGSGTADPYCVSPDTLVETPVGLLPASEIQQGDYLRSHTGAWRRVEAQKKRRIHGGEKVFQFKVASLAAFPFTVSEGHPILAVHGVGSRKKPREGLTNPEFIAAKDLKKGDYVAYPTRRNIQHGQELDLADYLPERAATSNWVYRRLSQGAAEAYEWLEGNNDPQHAWGEREKLLAEKGWSEDDYATAYSMRGEQSPNDRHTRFLAVSPGLARLVGYYLAEGSQGSSLVSFALHIKERSIAEHIEQIVKSLNFRGVSHHERPAQNGRSVQIEDVLLSEFLVNLCGEGFASKRMPAIISDGREEIVLEMLRGLFAGDGSDFKTETNRVALKLANPSMILEARRLLLSFGLIGGIVKEEPTETSISRSPAYHLSYNGLAADSLRLLFDGAPYTFFDTPQKSGLFYGDYVLLRLDDVVEVADVPEVIGFQMAEDKSFCVAGVATHNTSINLAEWREHVATEIARWRYDCITPETLVETEGGVCRADEVLAGKRLKNHLGVYSVVEKVWRRPLREGERAFQIVAHGLRGAVPTVSEGHPFLTRRKKNEGHGHQISAESVFLRAKDLRVGDYVGYPIPKFEEHGRKELDLADFVECAIRDGRSLCRLPRQIPFDEELCWVAGLYLAEGSVGPKQVLFALHAAEEAFTQRLDRFFKERFDAGGFTAQKTEFGIQRGYSSEVAAQFFHELCEGVSATKRIHPILKGAGDRRLAALIRGYLDGDGCYHENDTSGACGVPTASRQLAADVREVLLSKGILPGLTYMPPAPYNICGKKGVSHGNYKVTTHGVSTDQLLKWVGVPHETSATDSKIGVFADGYVWHRIYEIREVEAAEVIGFQMSKEVSVKLEDDTEAHGSFCLWGISSINTNYIPIMPLPIGNQTIGGDGKALLLTSEIEQWSDHILVGMGVPREFVFGGLSYAGTNLSMRMMENFFLDYIGRHRDLLNWVVRQVGSYLKWPTVRTRFKPFKMADDLQRKAYEFQLNQAALISDTSLLSGSDYDQEEEAEIRIRETAMKIESQKKQQLAMAELQGEAQLIMAKYQAQAQQVTQAAMMQPAAQGEPGGPEAGGAAGGTPGGQEAAPLPPGMEGATEQQAPQPQAGQPPQDQSPMAQMQSPLSMQQGKTGGGDLKAMAMAQAKLIAGMDPQLQEMAVNNIRAQSPELADLVLQILKGLQKGVTNQAAASGQPQVDMRPLPEQRAPRRQTNII